MKTIRQDVMEELASILEPLGWKKTSWYGTRSYGPAGLDGHGVVFTEENLQLRLMKLCFIYDGKTISHSGVDSIAAEIMAMCNHDNISHCGMYVLNKNSKFRPCHIYDGRIRMWGIAYHIVDGSIDRLEGSGYRIDDFKYIANTINRYGDNIPRIFREGFDKKPHGCFLVPPNIIIYNSSSDISVDENGINITYQPTNRHYKMDRDSSLADIKRFILELELEL